MLPGVSPHSSTAPIHASGERRPNSSSISSRTFGRPSSPPALVKHPQAAQHEAQGAYGMPVYSRTTLTPFSKARTDIDHTEPQISRQSASRPALVGPWLTSPHARFNLNQPGMFHVDRPGGQIHDRVSPAAAYNAGYSAGCLQRHDQVPPPLPTHYRVQSGGYRINTTPAHHYHHHHYSAPVPATVPPNRVLTSRLLSRPGAGNVPNATFINSTRFPGRPIISARPAVQTAQAAQVARKENRQALS